MMSLHKKIMWGRSRSVKDLLTFSSESKGRSTRKKCSRASTMPKLVPIRQSKDMDSISQTVSSQQYSLLTEGGIRAHVLVDESNMNVFERLVNSLVHSKSWERHHIILNDDRILTSSAVGEFSAPIKYNTMEKVVAFDLTKGPVHCIKFGVKEKTYLFQAPSAFDRDRLLHSICWKMDVDKYRRLLFNATKSDTLMRDLQCLVALTVGCSLYVEDTHRIVLDLVSSLLNEKSTTINDLPQEAIITTLAPLLDRNQPTKEVCAFFTKHCHQCPRSMVVVEMFSPIVKRILKQTADFGKCTWLRTFVVEFLQTLSAQNNGSEAVRAFVRTMHGPMSECPHPRTLNNLAAVCLSAIYQCFASPEQQRRSNREGKKYRNPHHRRNRLPSPANTTELLNNQRNAPGGKQQRVEKNVDIFNNKLLPPHDCNEEKRKNNDVVARDVNLKECHAERKPETPTARGDNGRGDEEKRLRDVAPFIEVMREITTLPDWRSNLACLLQPLPFPNDSIRDKNFVKLMYTVVERFTSDDRASVVNCFTQSRAGKESWLDVYSPRSAACDDDGRLFTKMVRTHFHSTKMVRRVRRRWLDENDFG